MLMNCPLRKPLPVGQAGRVRASQESQGASHRARFRPDRGLVRPRPYRGQSSNQGGDAFICPMLFLACQAAQARGST